MAARGAAFYGMAGIMATLGVGLAGTAAEPLLALSFVPIVAKVFTYREDTLVGLSAGVGGGPDAMSGALGACKGAPSLSVF